MPKPQVNGRIESSQKFSRGGGLALVVRLGTTRKKKFPVRVQHQPASESTVSVHLHFHPVAYFPGTMAHCERASRPLIQCFQRSSMRGLSGLQLQTTRAFQTTAVAREEAQTEAASQPFYKSPDPSLVSSPRLERRLIRQGILPVGSRRRRAALQGAPSVPFEQLPYQCFQEARKILLSDREQKLEEITATSEKIAKIQALPAEERAKNSTHSRLRALEIHLEKLKVLADINDPLVKKKFEDGQGN